MSNPYREYKPPAYEIVLVAGHNSGPEFLVVQEQLRLRGTQGFRVVSCVLNSNSGWVCWTLERRQEP